MRRRITVVLTSSTCEEYDLGPLKPQPIDFILYLEACSFTYYSLKCRLHRSIDPAVFETIVGAALEASQAKGGGLGCDTAYSRSITRLSLEVDAECLKTCRWIINHHESEGELHSPGWSRLLRAGAELVADDVDDQELGHWLFLLDRCEGEGPPDGYTAGKVIRCPDKARLLRFPFGSGLYIRAGQAPGPTCLILAKPATPWGAEVVIVETEDGSPSEEVVARLPLPQQVFGRIELQGWPRLTNRDLLHHDILPLVGNPERREFEFIFRGDEWIINLDQPTHGLYVQRVAT